MKIERKLKTIIIENKFFDIASILECGQIFSFLKKSDNEYVVVSMNKVATVIIEGNKTIIKSKDIDYFYHFFDLDTNYDFIENKIIKISPPFKDEYQTIISFIVSANNNIKRIKGILNRISEKFGSFISEYQIYSFPTLKQLSKATKEDFEKVGAGYRSDYLVKTIKQLQHPRYNIEELKKLNTKELKIRLLELFGVGPKVADCILFFGFGRTDVFIVDTWIKKSYTMFSDEKRNEKQISQYFVNMFGVYSGYAQQYLFDYMLHKNN